MFYILLRGSYAGVQACSFRDMLLKPELQRAIGDAGFEHPSEVQQNAIPFAMVGNDMIVKQKFFYFSTNSHKLLKKRVFNSKSGHARKVLSNRGRRIFNEKITMKIVERLSKCAYNCLILPL